MRGEARYDAWGEPGGPPPMAGTRLSRGRWGRFSMNIYWMRQLSPVTNGAIIAFHGPQTPHKWLPWAPPGHGASPARHAGAPRRRMALPPPLARGGFPLPWSAFGGKCVFSQFWGHHTCDFRLSTARNPAHTVHSSPVRPRSDAAASRLPAAGAPGPPAAASLGALWRRRNADPGPNYRKRLTIRLIPQAIPRTVGTRPPISKG